MRDGVTTFLNILAFVVVIVGIISVATIIDGVKADLAIPLAISDGIFTLMLVISIQMYNNVRLIRLQQAETHQKMYYMQQMLFNIYQNTSKQIPTRNNMQPPRNIPQQNNNVGVNYQTGTLNRPPYPNN